MSWTPPPGTIGLTYSRGFAAFRASLGHRLLGESSYYTHAVVVVDEVSVVEPWPTGARLADRACSDGEYVVYGWLPGLPDETRARIARAAISMCGIGYGVADYAALAAYRRGARRPGLLRLLAAPDRLLPAQFVAEAYRRAGVHLLPDRPAFDVTLDEVGELFLASQQWEMRVPCAQYV